MKVRKRYEVPEEQFNDFISEHSEEPMRINKNMKLTGGKVVHSYLISIDTEMTLTEFHMENLRLLADSNTVTAEEKDAINYGISAIKTLEDMGVII